MRKEISNFIRPEDGPMAMGGYENIAQLVDEACHRIVGGADPDYTLPTLIRERFGHLPLLGRYDKERIRQGLGATLRLIDLDLSSAYKDVLFPHERPEVELEDDARTLDIGVLSGFLVPGDEEHNGDGVISLERIRSRHARRRLILATMAWIADASDVPEWIHDDLRFINDRRRSMFDEQLHTVYIVAERKSRTRGAPIIKQSISVHMDREEAYGRTKKLGRRASTIRYMCRRGRVGNQVFYVHTNARRKPLFSTLLKTMRNLDKDPDRLLMDARGFLEVVVAVEDDNGRMVRPTRDHALMWAAHTVSELWDEEGMLLEHALVKKQATHGSRDYGSVRNLGRVIRIHDGLVIGGRVEQQIMPIGDYLATQCVTTEHHDVYAWTRVRLDFLPRMFPHLEWGGRHSGEFQDGIKRILSIIRAREG